MKRIESLCNPAMFYLVISSISYFLILIQNVNNPNELCVGDMKCATESKPIVFIVKALYIMFWTFVLDFICKRGYTKIAWFILFFPFVIFFILLALFILMNIGGALERTVDSSSAEHVEGYGAYYAEDARINSTNIIQ
jgi:hypothetical protein